jgi:hypothetical protein
MPILLGFFRTDCRPALCDGGNIREADPTGKLKRLGGHPIPRTPGRSARWISLDPKCAQPRLGFTFYLRGVPRRRFACRTARYKKVI